MTGGACCVDRCLFGTAHRLSTVDSTVNCLSNSDQYTPISL